MAYTWISEFDSGLAGQAGVYQARAVVYGADGNPLSPAPPVIVEGYAGTNYLILVTMPSGTLGAVRITDATGFRVFSAVVAPREEENPDVLTSSRLALTDYVVPPTVQDISDAVVAGVIAALRTISPPLLPDSGESYNIRRGDDVPIPLLLGPLNSLREIWFTVKNSENDPDESAILQVTLTGGLVWLNGVPATNPGQARIRVLSMLTGAAEVKILAEASKLLPDAGGRYCDTQVYDRKGIRTVDVRHANLIADISRSIPSRSIFQSVLPPSYL